MDDESGDDDRDELTSEWRRESRHDWRRWRNESGSLFQRRGDAYLNERSVIDALQRTVFSFDEISNQAYIGIRYLARFLVEGCEIR